MINNLSILAQVCIVFIAQFIYVWARTINVKDISNGDAWKGVVSNTIVQIVYLVTVFFGISSIMSFTTHWPILVSYIGSGALATLLAIKKSNK